MSVYDWNVGAIYEDKHGNRWLVTSGFTEPTVEMQQIQPVWSDEQPKPAKQFGGVSGLMWEGFKKVLEAPECRAATKRPTPSE